MPEMTSAQWIQLLVLIISLLALYAGIVRAFERITIKVMRHDSLLFDEHSEVLVVTHTACNRIRKACPANKAAGG